MTKRRFKSLLNGFIVSVLLYVAVQFLNSQLRQIPEISKGFPTVSPQTTVIATGSPAVLGEQEPTELGELAVVKKVVDGDTIELENGQHVRYIGIDTPESKKPNTPIQCFAIEASKRNVELVEGKQVRLVKDVSHTDRYDRLLRYVYVDGVFINKQLVEEGYAFARSYPPDIAFQKDLQAAEGHAREQHKGLWAQCEVKNGRVQN